MNLSRYSVSALPFAKALTTHLTGNIIKSLCYDHFYHRQLQLTTVTWFVFLTTKITKKHQD